MSCQLPPHLLRLFAPRDPVEFVPFPELPRHGAYSGVAGYLAHFEDAAADSAARAAAAAKVHVPTASELRAARRQQRIAANSARIAEQAARWDPRACTPEHDHVTRNPYRTLVLYRLPYTATEEQLRAALEECGGPVRGVRIVRNSTTGKPRGYAFAEFESSAAMHRAYRKADGMELGGKRVLVDYERGRTRAGWLPARLGGGRNETRLSDDDKARLLAANRARREREREEAGDSTR